jgi:hypothetical protein
VHAKCVLCRQQIGSVFERRAGFLEARLPHQRLTEEEAGYAEIWFKSPFEKSSDSRFWHAGYGGAR